MGEERGEDGVVRCLVQWRRCIGDNSSRGENLYSYFEFDSGNPIGSLHMYVQLIFVDAAVKVQHPWLT